MVGRGRGRLMRQRRGALRLPGSAPGWTESGRSPGAAPARCPSPAAVGPGRRARRLRHRGDVVVAGRGRRQAALGGGAGRSSPGVAQRGRVGRLGLRLVVDQALEHVAGMMTAGRSALPAARPALERGQRAPAAVIELVELQLHAAHAVEIAAIPVALEHPAGAAQDRLPSGQGHDEADRLTRLLRTARRDEQGVAFQVRMKRCDEFLRRRALRHDADGPSARTHGFHGLAQCTPDARPRSRTGRAAASGTRGRRGSPQTALQRSRRVRNASPSGRRAPGRRRRGELGLAHRRGAVEGPGQEHGRPVGRQAAPVVVLRPAEGSRPQPVSGRRQRVQERVLLAGADQRPVEHVELAPEPAGHVHGAVRVGRHRRADVLVGVAQPARPQRVAVGSELGDEHVGAPGRAHRRRRRSRARRRTSR